MGTPPSRGVPRKGVGNMKKIKIGLVAVASPVESGGERGDHLLARAKKAITDAGMEVVTYPELIWDAAAAIDACAKLKEEKINSLVVMDITWVVDSMKYIFTTQLQVPTVYWAVPYTETFSIGCIQHYGSILKAMGFTYGYVYGLPEEAEVIEGIRTYAKVGAAVENTKNMIIGLAGPRQTWRVAGPQDMSKEEWDFTIKTGVSFVHIEMEEITEIADQISDADAAVTLEGLKKRSGKSVASDAALLYNAKVYMATKEIIAKYQLTSLAAECYPNYGGLMNLIASWLGDEGFYLDTEGDLGHTFIINTLNQFAGGGVVALGEAGSIDEKRNLIPVAHEGSTPMSLADDLSRAQINPSGELGTFVGVPHKALDTVTTCAIVGNGGKYKVFVAKGRTLGVTHEEWVEGGSKLLVNLQYDVPARSVIDQLIKGGMDHHFVIKEGDYTKEMEAFCDYMGFETLNLG